MRPGTIERGDSIKPSQWMVSASTAPGCAFFGKPMIASDKAAIPWPSELSSLAKNVRAAGELLRFHPHIHVLMADGAWLPDGTFRHLLYFDAQKVERLFRAEVLRMLFEKGRIDALHVV